MGTKNRELGVDQLRKRSGPSQFPFESTADLSPLQRVIGQERALRAIDFGIDIPSYGYNMFVVGPAGSGRTTAVRRFLDRRASRRPAPADWCYVYNFDDARRPRAISLPAGRASELREAMEELVSRLQQEIPRAFEGEYYEQRRRELLEKLQQQQQQLLQSLEQYLNERDFALIRSQAGLGILPMMNGEPMTAQAYEKLDPDTKRKFESHRPELQEQFEKTMRATRQLDRQARGDTENINKEMAGFVVDNLMDDIKGSFGDCEKVLHYLSEVREDAIRNASSFTSKDSEQESPLAIIAGAREERPSDRYRVNVLSETCGEDACAPVVIEDNPTYHNLIGRIEHRAEFGAMVTDHTQICAGALHRANSGYLVLEAKSILANPVVWEALKRALRNRKIKIEEVAQLYGLVATSSLEPEPIPLDIKVVIIGDERLYQLLYAYDEDFRELFKVKAQFATRMPRGEESPQEYARFVGDLCRRENLHHFDSGAMASLYDEAARWAEDQNRVTTRFADVADLVREASFWAEKSERESVTAEDVRKAVAERTHRLNYASERYRETIQDGVILIDTTGSVTGQVNGLSVIQTANHAFGLPSRITAKTFVGKAGVVSIDREVKMSGPIHDKGQLILSSYLSSRFAQNGALNVSASLTFEQQYSGVEGDSASSTELYALLSSLSQVPIKQNLAVTGSVNQLGQVQAIGGVNAKIEGFYDLCKTLGLTGDQGVLIPTSNVNHLMLREDVVEAVAKGEFHVYSVSTIEEGIELLTGVPAGEADQDGHYSERTVYALVQARLERYAECMKREGEEEEEASSAKRSEEEE